MPISATVAPSSLSRYLDTMCSGSVWLEALRPSVCCQGSHSTVPGASPRCAASTNTIRSGAKRRSAPVTFSGAGPASITSTWSSAAACVASSRAAATPATSSPSSSCPTPTTATRGGVPRSLRLWLIAVIRLWRQGLGDVIGLSPDEVVAIPREGRQLPLLVRQRNRVLIAACSTLRAERALVEAVAHHEALGLAVHHDHLKGVGRAVLGAQAAAGARLAVPDHMAAQVS